MDNMEINHIDYDIENNQVPIVQEKVTQSQRGIEDTISEINKGLEGLRLELPKTKEKQEKEVLELVKVRGLKKSFENNRFSIGITINKIKEGVFSVVSNKTGNVNYFVNEKGDIIFGISNIKERPFLDNGKAYELAGYIERKEGGLYNMYKIVGGKEVGPIDIDFPEYYQAWLDIIFYADILNKLVSLKFNDPETKKGIEILVDGGSFKYEDLKLFLERGLITNEIFDYGVEEMKKVIVSQCRDERLINLTGYNKESLGIRESDLKRYLEAGYINGGLAKKCYYVLPDKMKNLSEN